MGDYTEQSGTVGALAGAARKCLVRSQLLCLCEMSIPSSITGFTCDVVMFSSVDQTVFVLPPKKNYYFLSELISTVCTFIYCASIDIRNLMPLEVIGEVLKNACCIMHLFFITSLLMTFTNIIFLLITQATVTYLAFECPHFNL